MRTLVTFGNGKYGRRRTSSVLFTYQVPFTFIFEGGWISSFNLWRNQSCLSNTKKTFSLVLSPFYELHRNIWYFDINTRFCSLTTTRYFISFVEEGRENLQSVLSLSTLKYHNDQSSRRVTLVYGRDRSIWVSFRTVQSTASMHLQTLYLSFCRKRQLDSDYVRKCKVVLLIWNFDKRSHDS